MSCVAQGAFDIGVGDFYTRLDEQRWPDLSRDGVGDVPVDDRPVDDLEEVQSSGVRHRAHGLPIEHPAVGPRLRRQCRSQNKRRADDCGRPTENLPNDQGKRCRGCLSELAYVKPLFLYDQYGIYNTEPWRVEQERRCDILNHTAFSAGVSEPNGGEISRKFSNIMTLQRGSRAQFNAASSGARFSVHRLSPSASDW